MWFLKNVNNSQNFVGMIDRIRKYVTSLEKEAIPQLSINCVIFGFHEKTLKVIVNRIPLGKSTLFVLPGGYIRQTEDLTDAVESKKFLLSADEIRTLERIKPLNAINPLTFDADAVNSTFSQPTSGGGSGAPGTSHRPTNMKVSGEVTLKSPNILIFDNVDGTTPSQSNTSIRHA